MKYIGSFTVFQGICIAYFDLLSEMFIEVMTIVNS